MEYHMNNHKAHAHKEYHYNDNTYATVPISLYCKYCIFVSHPWVRIWHMHVEIDMNHT